jgi:2-amino-4-hydroxy-6-hydroxymethyldihydropteridine diphosphokinase
MRYYLSLGSNLGDKRNHLARALAALKKAGVKVLRSSSIYRTQPVGYTDQPWFYNQVVEVSTDLEPAGLLALIKTMEKGLGRRPAPRNRPRMIDIDILIAEDRVITSRQLTIPHPRMTERNFVLVPLLEIAPVAVHPLLEETILEIYKKSRDKAQVIQIAKTLGRSSAKES